jgi:GDP-D-mannose 3',5'-epimerase
MNSKSALVLGAGGFIGGHLVKRFKREGFWVRGVDLKFNPFAETQADDFVVVDLRDPGACRQVIDRRFDEVYQLAADMGGAGYIFTGEHDADVIHNSATINLNVLDECVEGELHQNTLPLINIRKLGGWDITAMEGFFSSLNIARTTRHI